MYFEILSSYLFEISPFKNNFNMPTYFDFSHWGKQCNTGSILYFLKILQHCKLGMHDLAENDTFHFLIWSFDTTLKLSDVHSSIHIPAQYWSSKAWVLYMFVTHFLAQQQQLEVSIWRSSSKVIFNPWQQGHHPSSAGLKARSQNWAILVTLVGWNWGFSGEEPMVLIN